MIYFLFLFLETLKYYLQIALSIDLFSNQIAQPPLTKVTLIMTMEILMTNQSRKR